jgi:DNA-binding NarL/FixJ family response regulator
MRVLFLDDEELRHRAVKRFNPRFTHTYTARQAIEALAASRYEVCFLDHDLGGPETGHDVARWLAQQEPTNRPSRVFVHSMNPVGVARMVRTLTDAGVCATGMMFGCDDFIKTIKQI